MHRFRFVTWYDLVMALYVLLALALSHWQNIRVSFRAVLNFQYDLAFIALMALYLWIVACVVAIQERSSGRDRIICGRSWWARMRRDYINLQVGWDALRLLVWIKLMFAIYGSIKQAIPRLHPGDFDAELFTIDRWTHLGADPINAIHAIFATKPLMLAMDWLYVAWYGVMAPTLVVFMLTSNRRLHTAFFTCFFLLWIIGGLAAVAVPSLGPIYVDPQQFEHVYMPTARELQERLWVQYEKVIANPNDYSVVLYEGIAAFPSLHVGLIALFACFLFRINKWVAWAMVVYTVIIQLGSVQLGWHYAVDGYAAIAFAVLMYLACRRWIGSSNRTLAADAPPHAVQSPA